MAVDNVLLAPIPRQSFSIELGGQPCTIRLVSILTWTYLDMTIDDVYVMRGAICLDRAPVKQYRTIPFVGNLFFVDTQGRDDPYYTGFETRFKLFYVTDDELLPPDFQERSYLRLF